MFGLEKKSDANNYLQRPGPQAATNGIPALLGLFIAFRHSGICNGLVHWWSNRTHVRSRNLIAIGALLILGNIAGDAIIMADRSPRAHVLRHEIF